MQPASEKKPNRLYCVTDIHNAEVGDIFTHCTAPFTPYIVISVMQYHAYAGLSTKITYIPLCEFFNIPSREHIHFYCYTGKAAPEFDVHCDMTKVFKENFKIDKSLINKHYRWWCHFFNEQKFKAL